MDISEVNELTCKHCSNAIASLNHVSDHSCFRGKEVYMTHNNVLFAKISKSCSQTVNNISSQESFSQDQDNQSQDEDNQSQDENHNIKESNKQDAVWTRNKTLALLSLYEANNILDNPRKKTKIWAAISSGLYDLNIKVSSDQVRWRMNYLMKKYKECVDNNLKSGRSTMSFEFFDEMENIFGYKKNAIATYSVSSNLPLKVSKSSSISKSMEVQPHTSKKQKITDLNYSLVSTSPNSSASASPNTLANTSTNASKNINYENKENECIKPSCEKKSTSSQLKNKFENYCLEYMQKEEKRREERDENILKIQKDALKLKKYYAEMREKELEVKKTIAINKIKSKEKRHEELLEIEKLKCNLLKKLLNDKEHFKFSDSE